MKSTIKKLLLWKKTNFNSNDAVIESGNLSLKRDSKNKDYSSTSNLTVNSTDGTLLRRSDRSLKDNLETKNSPVSNERKMVKAISLASLSSPRMRQSRSIEKCKSTSKLPSFSKVANAYSLTPKKINEADSVYKRKMLRSRSTDLLKSLTPISGSKKVDKNTMSRAKSVSALKISSEGKQAEIQEPVSRNVRAKLYKNNCVETPTDSDKIVRKKNVPTVLSYSSGKLQKANTNSSENHKLRYTNSHLHRKESKGSAEKRTISKNSAKSVDKESDDKHSSTWSENQLSKIKSQSNVQQEGLTENPLDRIKSIKLSSKLEEKSKHRIHSANPSDTKEVKTGSFDHNNSSSSYVSTPAKMRVLNPEYSSDISDSSYESLITQKKNVNYVYLNSSESSLTSSSQSESSKLDDNNDSNSSNKRKSEEGLPLSKKKKYKHIIKPNKKSQASKDNKQALNETKSQDDYSNKSLNSTKPQTYNTSKIKTPIISNKQTYSQVSSKEVNVTDKGKGYPIPKRSNVALSEIDAQSLSVKRISQQSYKNKPARNSLSYGPVEKDYQKGSLHSDIHQRYLKSFTRKLHFVQANEIGDVSESAIQNITLPEKFDLHCKVRITILILDKFELKHLIEV